MVSRLAFVFCPSVLVPRESSTQLLGQVYGLHNEFHTASNHIA
jgi:hypothetical protein